MVVKIMSDDCRYDVRVKFDGGGGGVCLYYDEITPMLSDIIARKGHEV